MADTKKKTAAEKDSQDKYLDAEKRRIGAKRRPSKLSDFPLVAMVENSDGELIPVYRNEE